MGPIRTREKPDAAQWDTKSVSMHAAMWITALSAMGAFAVTPAGSVFVKWAFAIVVAGTVLVPSFVADKRPVQSLALGLLSVSLACNQLYFAVERRTDLELRNNDRMLLGLMRDLQTLNDSMSRLLGSVINAPDLEALPPVATIPSDHFEPEPQPPPWFSEIHGAFLLICGVITVAVSASRLDAMAGRRAKKGAG